MDEDTRRLLIPRRIDDPPKFLFWDFDVALVWMSFVVLGMVMEYMGISMIIGTVAAMGYAKLRGGATRGFGMHALYWHIGLSLGRRTPPSRKRHFIG